MRIYALVFCGFYLSIGTGCAYRLSTALRTLPGGYEQLAIPIFENRTAVVAIEPYFTNSLVEEFERSKIAKVVSDSVAPVVLKGKILSIRYEREAPVRGGQNTEISNLPAGTSLATQFRIKVIASLSLVRNSDSKVIWDGQFDNEIIYAGPRIGTPIVNSANANYNHSIRKTKISELASVMMQEAHDRVTENF